jgi:hypothetical protein
MFEYIVYKTTVKPSPDLRFLKTIKFSISNINLIKKLSNIIIRIVLEKNQDLV